MSTDRARRSHDANRMYRSVVLQQGRVTLEADANEAEEIRGAEAQNSLVDVIGPSGSRDAGFKISVPAPGGAAFDFAIGEGTLYVGGIRLRSIARIASYTDQYRSQWAEWADYPAGDFSSQPTAGTRELVYLDLSEQEVGAVEDPALREPALGGPDTAARTRMIQRVKRVRVGASGCEAAFSEALTKLGISVKAGQADAVAWFDETSMRLTATLQLKAATVALTTQQDPCEPLAQAGFLGPENQLIRVQVAEGGAKLLWGYDNASFLYGASVASAVSTQLKLDSPPVDVSHHPRPGQFVEVLATAVKLGKARIAARVGAVAQVERFEPDDNTLTLKGVQETFFTQLPKQVFVRVWENLLDIPLNEDAEVTLRTAQDASTGLKIWMRGGKGVEGDHWLIGVRPSTPEEILPARLADFQPPDGPRRLIVPLAVIAWQGDRSATVTDCRNKFDNLITPHDCNLEFHNQHLHGWGVVCGLQVQCMLGSDAVLGLARPHEAVIVHDGYAIHPSGADIRLRSGTEEHYIPLALGDLAVAEGALQRVGDVIQDGSVSLWIDKDCNLHVDRYDPGLKQGWEQLLAGTILVDIYRDCVVKVIDYVRAQLFDPSSGAPDGTTERRRIALFNLFFQLINASTGPHIYLSGLAPGEGALPARIDTEHALLRELFEGLKGLLQSKTFCALFDDIDYPIYDVYRGGLPQEQPRPTTIFGSGRHARIRVHPNGQRAFSFGADGKVNVYGLQGDERRLLKVNDFSGTDIQDLAVARNGDIYAIAWAGSDHVDSVFLVGNVATNGTLRLEVLIELPSLKLCTLAVVGGGQGAVYASARGQGIIALDIAARTHRLVASFSASGHLIPGLLDGDVLYAGENAGDPHPVAFTRVLGFRLGGPESLAPVYHFALPLDDSDGPGIGHDDLAVLPSAVPDFDDVCAIVDGVSPRKRLLVWEPNDVGALEEAGVLPRRVIDLGESSASRIAYSRPAVGERNAGWAMITYEDGSLGRVYRPGSDGLVLDPDTDSALLHPLQVGPAAIATDPRGQAFYVLESLSNTITVIPAAPDARSTIDFAKLESYRQRALAAFLKTIGRVAQYLKDCVCEHMLISCPTGIGKVYLADVSFKDGKVYQICNFHSRKYVHTFPTVEYWMSFVPIIPMLKYAVEKFCCTPTAGLFDALVPKEVAGNEESTDRVSPTMLRHGLDHLRAAALPAQLKLRLDQVGKGFDFGKERLGNELKQPSRGNASRPIDTNDLAHTAPDVATGRARAHGLEVRKMEPTSDDLQATLAILTAPPLTRGETVDLITDPRGRVIGWKRVEAADEPRPPDATGIEVDRLRRELEKVTGASAKQKTELTKKLKNVTDAHAKQRAELTKKLKKMTDAHAEQKAELTGTQKQLTTMQKQMTRMTAQIKRLQG